MGLLSCSWRPLVVVLIVVVLVLVALLMALVVAAVLMVLVGSVGIVVSPVTHKQIIRQYGECKLTTRHSNHHSHAPGGSVHSLAAAHHVADIPDGHNSLGYARHGSMSLWLGVHGHNHRHSGLEDGPT